tara:strand:+ start:4417 stop:5826 length:1410 start_codon:yes stop_codon:yes gene_type:complete
MTLEIKWDSNIRSIEDALIKIESNLAGVSEKTLALQERQKQMDQRQLLQDRKNFALNQELLQAQRGALDDAQDQEDNAPVPEAQTGSSIQGMKGNEGEGVPTEQPGTEAAAIEKPIPSPKEAPAVITPPAAEALPPAPISTSLREDFGMDAPEIIDLLIKGGPESEKFIPIILERLRGEQFAVLKSFDWFDENDWEFVRLHDNDYFMLSKYADRLELPLRMTMASAKRAKDEDEMADVWKEWHSRLDAEYRLSWRERGILEGALDVIQKHGDMNAQTLTSYGINGTAAEIASLIKSYGYLFDVQVVGRGRKSDDRSYYYGTTAQPIYLKKIDSFIGNLWEFGGKLDFTAPQGPRLFLPFESKRGEDYAVLLKAELGVEGIAWEGDGFVIDGYRATTRSAKMAMPFLDFRKSHAAMLLASLDEEHLLHKQAKDLVRLSCATAQEEVEIRKELNLTDEQLLELTEELSNGY